MNQPTESVKSCPECGADNVHFANHCWMCGGDLKDVPILAVLAAEAKPDPGAAGKPAWAREDSTGLMLVGALAALVLLVGIGVYANEPTLVIPYAIVASPALLATFIRATRKKIQNKPMGVLETVGMFLLSFLISGVVAAGIAIVLVAVAIVGLIAFCFAELSKH